MEHELLELWSSVEKDKEAVRERAIAARLARAAAAQAAPKEVGLVCVDVCMHACFFLLQVSASACHPAQYCMHAGAARLHAAPFTIIPYNYAPLIAAAPAAVLYMLCCCSQIGTHRLSQFAVSLGSHAPSMAMEGVV